MELSQVNVVELAATAQRTSTLTATGVDVRSYDGIAQIILTSSAATAGTSPTLDVKIQESDSLGSGYTDISGAAFAQVTDAADSTQMIALNIGEHKQYLRVIGTIGGTATPTFQFGVVMVANRESGRNASQSV